jgi:hypothetical protein
LVAPFLGIVQPELTPESISGVTDTLEAADYFALSGIGVEHTLPVSLILFALAAFASAILADWARIVSVAR